jgi:hypothetical protein
MRPRRRDRSAAGRAAGPLHLRFVLQPIVAMVLGIRAGLDDARVQRPAFLWVLLSEPSERRALILAAWKGISRLFVMSFVLDSVYQLLLFRWFYALQAVIVAFVLAIVPYVVIRGPIQHCHGRRHKLFRGARRSGRVNAHIAGTPQILAKAR